VGNQPHDRAPDMIGLEMIGTDMIGPYMNGTAKRSGIGEEGVWRASERAAIC
jgi:hypothetical protein